MPAAGLGLIALAGLMALADGPNRKLYAFSVAWVFIAMAPVLNLGILYPTLWSPTATCISAHSDGA